MPAQPLNPPRPAGVLDLFTVYIYSYTYNVYFVAMGGPKWQRQGLAKPRQGLVKASSRPRQGLAKASPRPRQGLAKASSSCATPLNRLPTPKKTTPGGDIGIIFRCAGVRLTFSNNMLTIGTIFCQFRVPKRDIFALKNQDGREDCEFAKI